MKKAAATNKKAPAKTLRARTRRSLPWWSLLTAAMPPLFVGWCVLAYSCSADYPVWEEWDFMPEWDRFLSGGRWIHGLFESYYGHHPAFSMFLLLVLGKLTHFAPRPELALVWVLTAVLVGIYGWWLWRAHRLLLLLLPIATLLLFTLRSMEIFFDGWNFQVPLVFIELQLVLSLLAIGSLTWWRLACALVISFLAAFTWGSGQVAFMIGAFILSLRRPLPRIELAAWMTVSAASLALYWSLPSSIPWQASSADGSNYCRGFLLLLGNSLIETNSIWPGILISGVVSLLVVVVVIPKLPSLRDPALLPWFGMLVFILATLSAIITVRVIPSETSAQFSRYAFVTSQLLLVILAILSTVKMSGTQRDPAHLLAPAALLWPLRGAVGCCCLALVAVSLWGNYQMIAKLRVWQPGLRQTRIIARQAPWCLTPELLLGSASNDRKALERGLEIMRRWQVGVFRPRPGVPLPAQGLSRSLSCGSLRLD
jgi:hypothetical protein